MSKLTQAQFQLDIADHIMEVIKDDGVYRHIRFRAPGTMMEHFDLITWPGYLSYAGDMGCYVFSRVHDMFEFFRRPEHCRYTIDMRYWAEKVQAGDKAGAGNGVTEFSKAAFDANVRRWVENFAKCELEDADEQAEAALCTCAINDLREAVEREVIGADDNDVRCFDAAHEFRFGANDSEAWSAYFGEESTFEFVDFWEVDCTEYTYRFQWCCFALSWAIQTYDQAKAAPARDPRVADMFEVAE